MQQNVNQFAFRVPFATRLAVKTRSSAMSAAHSVTNRNYVMHARSISSYKLALEIFISAVLSPRPHWLVCPAGEAIQGELQGEQSNLI